MIKTQQHVKHLLLNFKKHTYTYTVLHVRNLFNLSIIPIKKKTEHIQHYQKTLQNNSFNPDIHFKTLTTNDIRVPELPRLVIHHGEPYRDTQENLWRQGKRNAVGTTRVAKSLMEMRNTSDHMLSGSPFSKLPNRCHSL